MVFGGGLDSAGITVDLLVLEPSRFIRMYANLTKDAMYYIFWMFVSVALVGQHSKRMRRIILSAVCLAVSFFSLSRIIS